MGLGNLLPYKGVYGKRQSSRLHPTKTTKTYPLSSATNGQDRQQKACVLFIQLVLFTAMSRQETSYWMVIGWNSGVCYSLSLKQYEFRLCLLERLIFFGLRLERLSE